MTNRNLTVAALLVAIVVVAGGTGAYLASSKSNETGEVSIYVKDLPADWIHINVTFSEVKIHKASEDNESGWYSLALQTQTVDLISLTNVSELLAAGNVSAGKYTQLRLVVVSVLGTMTNGTMVEFDVPSGELKTTHPFNVTAGHTEKLTLDFDLSRCIVHNAQGWKFTPVLGSITEG